jgi:hypothetical protein
MQLKYKSIIAWYVESNTLTSWKSIEILTQNKMQLRKWLSCFSEVSHIVVVTTRSPRVKFGIVGKSMPELGRLSKKHSRSPRVTSLVILWVELLVREVRVKPPSHASDGAAEVTGPWCNIDAESCGRWRCRVVLAMTLLRRLDRNAMLMLSHADNGVTEATWPQCDIDAHANKTPGLIYLYKYWANRK